MLSPGTTLPIELTPGFGKKAQREFWRVWIDYNGDSDFDDDGEEVFAADNSKTTVNGNISVPLTVPQTTKMRISMKQGSAPSHCGDLSRGEVEDYTVDFSAGARYKSALVLGANPDEGLTDPALIIYPNPASKKLNLQMQGWDGEKLVRLISMTGRTLYLESISKNNVEIDIDSFPAGIYILKVENGLHEEFERIILQ